MPEMRFVIRWPDGRRESCYSPSLVIRDFLREGESYPVPDFLQRSREALQIASQRVQAKYGRACSLALGQLARIEATAAQFAGQDDARVACERFLDGEAR
ncbi:MAG TPA: MSMEG_0570 family nitrogen starvation response protein [Roseiarcus sp.]